MAVLASIIAQVLALVSAVSDHWAMVNAQVGYPDCLYTPATITVTECGQQLGSMIVCIVLVVVKYGTPALVEVLQGMVGTYVSV